MRAEDSLAGAHLTPAPTDLRLSTVGGAESRYDADMPSNNNSQYTKRLREAWQHRATPCLIIFPCFCFVWRERGARLMASRLLFERRVCRLPLWLLICLWQILFEHNNIASKPIFNVLMLLLQKVDGHLARAEYFQT